MGTGGIPWEGRGRRERVLGETTAIRAHLEDDIENYILVLSCNLPVSL